MCLISGPQQEVTYDMHTPTVTSDGALMSLTMGHCRKKGVLMSGGKYESLIDFFK